MLRFVHLVIDARFDLENRQTVFLLNLFGDPMSFAKQQSSLNQRVGIACNFPVYGIGREKKWFVILYVVGGQDVGLGVDDPFNRLHRTEIGGNNNVVAINKTKQIVGIKTFKDIVNVCNVIVLIQVTVSVLCKNSDACVQPKWCAFE